MNRRSYIKGIIALIGTGAGVVSLAKWAYLDYSTRADELWNKKTLVAELVEIIIPTTDTPGAKAALVHDYVINVILYCTDLRHQHYFYSSLQNVDRYAIREYGTIFLHCSVQQKVATVKHFADKADFYYPIVGKIRRKLLGEPFYTKLRHLTVEGYCQSKVGATQALMYDFIPGKFFSRVPVAVNQKSWATR